MAQQYRPLFKLAAGGMAEVYVAEAEAMAGFTKRVAIKRILPGLLKDERFVRMFLDEARLSLHLNHANIVAVFDIGKSDNTYFIVMEYVEGTTLKSLIEYSVTRGRRLSPPLVIWILNEILKGLDYAHELKDQDTRERLGIVHRDISPPNVLVSWNGEVKLTDFGLAKATTQLESTDPGVVKGKFSYLSPEAAHGMAVDARTDIFAVGILGWEMLAGRRLFLGETDYQTVELVRAAEVPSLRELNPLVPAELEQVLLKSLTRRTEDRYQTCTEFADDLLGVLFAMGQRVSSRDLRDVLGELRDAKEREKAVEPSTGGTNLILELLAEEMVNFRSIDDADGGSELITGAQPLDPLGGVDDYDPSAPLAVGLDDEPAPIATHEPSMVSAVPQPPSPPPSRPPSQAPAARHQPASATPTAPPTSASQSGHGGASQSGQRSQPGITTGSNSGQAPLPAIAHTRMQSPAPKPEPSSRGLLIVLLLLLLAGAGGAAYYFLVMLPAAG